MGLYGLQDHDNAFDVLGINPEGGSLKQARATLAKAGAFWMPSAAPESFDVDKLFAYRRAMHAYLILSYPGLWDEPMGVALERCPYPEIDAGEADPDWVAHFLAHASAEAEEEREDEAFVGASLLHNVGQHLVGLPAFIAGERIREVSTFRLDEIIAGLRPLPEISEKHFPQGAWAWGFTWRTTRWEAEGQIVRFEVKAMNARARDLWTGRSQTPLWEVTISMPWWLAATPSERRAMVHNILVQCQVDITGEGDDIGYKPKVKRHSLKQDGLHLARCGAPDLSTAFQVMAAFYHPRTRQLLEEAEARGVSNRCDLRAAGDPQERFEFEETPAGGGAAHEPLDEESDPYHIDDSPFGALAAQGREVHA